MSIFPSQQQRQLLTDLINCTHNKNILKGRTLHARILKNGSLSSIYIANTLLILYAKSNHLSKAFTLFNSIDDNHKDAGSWNSLINAFSQDHSPSSYSFAINLFRRMMRTNNNVTPNAHTLAGVFSAASNLYDVAAGRQAHSVAVKTACLDDVYVGSSLLNMYCKTGFVFDARKLFDRMPERNTVSLATMISGYASVGLADKAVEVFELMRREEEVENEFAVTSVLRALTSCGFVGTGRQVHSLAVKTGLIVSVANTLVTMYAKCGRLDDAVRTFEFSGDKNSITWSAMVTGYVRSGDCDKALILFNRMHSSGVSPSEFTLVGVVNACSDLCAVVEGKQMHGFAFKLGFGLQLYVLSALVDMYAKCGNLTDACKGFECIQQPDVVLWTSIITGYVQNGDYEGGLNLYGKMQMERVIPNEVTMACVLRACSSLAALDQGKQMHARIIKYGLTLEVPIGSSLLNMYCKTGFVFDARKLFDRMPERNTVSWATIISGYASVGLADKAVEVFELMRREEEVENEFAVTSVLSAMTSCEFVGTGRQVHSLAVKNGLICIVSVANALVTMYAKCDRLDDAVRTFEFSGDKNSITWSAMVTGYVHSGDCDKALILFNRMHSSGVLPSEFTLVGVVNACSDLCAVVEGKQMHGFAFKLGFGLQLYVLSALVDMYAKCGNLTDACKGFECIQQPDVVLWTSIITGYVQNGDYEGGLNLYGKMQMERVIPNEVTMACVLRACSSLAALDQGKQMHARIIKYGFTLEVPIGSALSAMYSKCGSLDDGYLIFWRMPARDVTSWNAMISGLSQNGHGNKALELFQKMLLEGIEPDTVTFVNLLSACSHMGLVDKGWYYFMLMFDEFNIAPTVEHYACMVDILSRAGMLNEAKEFIESATVDHGLCLWRILLGACKNHRNYEIGTYAGEKLMELGSPESSAYVLLSSIYTALGEWENVERVRRMMKARGVNKELGCSWIELKSLVHVFVVGDNMHPHIDEIRSELRLLTKLM